MKIEKITSQHRRDFTAIYKCEHCGFERYGTGYDDENYHNNVVPNMICEKCGKKADKSYRPLATRYAEGVQV